MQDKIREAVWQVMLELGVENTPAFAVEHPADMAHGDYSVNIAMVLAKTLGTNPRALAEKVVEKLTGKIAEVEKIDIAGPGFINLHLKRSFFAEQVASIEAHGASWGMNESWKGKKVLVEYTDPNPFKEFHVGHLFTNTVGESISRLFTCAGADVKRICYQGDVGLHVACALWGMQQLGITTDTDFTPADLGRAYAKGATSNKESEAAAAEIKVINKAVYERTDSTLNALYDKGRAVSLAYFETIYEKLGTKFDQYFFESEAGPKGKELVLSHPDIFTESDGAYVFDAEKYGLHTRVFLNSHGLPTYEAKELALAKMKEDVFGVYDHSVVSTAKEITEYFKVLKKAMSFIYPELEKKTEHVGHGMVRLPEGKMSSRTGQVIPALDFINEIKDAALERLKESGRSADETLAEHIAIGAIKYATLKSNIHGDTVFDRDRALSFEGDSGPYLQYTHARICSVLEKAKAVGVVPSTANLPEKAYDIERILYQYPEVVLLSLNERTPHHVSTYLTHLASAFNAFYSTEIIADPTDKNAPYKAAIATATRLTLQQGLNILAIHAPEKM